MSFDTTAAQEHFKATDPIMHKLFQNGFSSHTSIILPTPKPAERYFESIVSSIISQQISTKAADAVKARVVSFLGDITPKQVQLADFEALKACGLSGQKTKYIKHNAEVWHEIPSGNFVHMDNEAVIVELTKLYGIGRWTAEMFLMFSLARPDVFSYGDLGLMQSLFENYGYYPHWKRKIAATVENWSPHRTIASLCLWRHKDGAPVIL